MHKTYKFVLQSTNVNVNNQSFFIDWTQIPEYQQYKVSFSFISNSTNNPLNIINACIYCNLGCMNSYELFNDNYKNSNFLGFLNISCGDGNIREFQSDNSLNNSIYLLRRPSNNNITVEICSFDSIKTIYPAVLGSIQPYTLVLNFEEV
jgi:hypothetical protein